MRCCICLEINEFPIQLLKVCIDVVVVMMMMIACHCFSSSLFQSIFFCCSFLLLRCLSLLFVSILPFIVQSLSVSIAYAKVVMLDLLGVVVVVSRHAVYVLYCC